MVTLIQQKAKQSERHLQKARAAKYLHMTDQWRSAGRQLEDQCVCRVFLSGVSIGLGEKLRFLAVGKALASKLRGCFRRSGSPRGLTTTIGVLRRHRYCTGFGAYAPPGLCR